MKAIADGDSGSTAHSHLPKNTLTELLVKLLNDKDNLVGIDVITNLLQTLGGPVVKHEQTEGNSGKSFSNMNQNSRMYGDDDDNDDDDDDDDDDDNEDDDDLLITNQRQDSLNESSSNLQIDLNTSIKKNKRRYGDGNYSDYDNDDEYDDDDEENALVIEGTLEHEMNYKLIELDIEPSKLWSCPPVATEEAVFTPGEQQDQECDPRIKYYMDKENCNNIANYQLQLIQQNQLQQQQSQQQNTPTSPSATTISVKQEINEQDIKSTATAAGKKRIVDPRLKKNLNTSPTRSISPTPTTQQNKNDLISIQTRQLAGNSLLSQLPDLQFPKDINKNSSLFNNMTMNSQFQEASTVKLSIEDYKRKLHKPSTSTSQPTTSSSLTNSTMSILSSLTSNTSSNQSTNLTTPSNSSNDFTDSLNNSNNSNNNALPSIPSFSLNLQAPQSLHELLRNFQS